MSNYVDIGARCVGCHGCATVCPVNCISMVEDAEGFLYPEVNVPRCTDCGLCRKVCPVMSRTPSNDEPSAYAVKALDSTLREVSSSGGVFTLLAEQILDRGGDVFAAVFDDRLSVIHAGARSASDLDRMRGSKYTQSIVGNTYAQIRDRIRGECPVLFVGTPCQVAGLYSYLRGNTSGLLSADFICHGVPSPSVWTRYLAFQEEHSGSRVCNVSFRSKVSGWKDFSLVLEFENGSIYQQSHSQDLFMRAFLTDICLRPSCYRCEFKGRRRRGDITIADFWGIGHVLPEMDDDRGTSLVLISSGRGRSAFEGISPRIEAEQVPLAIALEYNSAALRSARQHPRRDDFYRDLPEMAFDALILEYCHIGRLQRLRGRAIHALKQAMGSFRS